MIVPSRWLLAFLTIVAGMANAAWSGEYISPECIAASRDGRMLYVTSAGTTRLLLFDIAHDRIISKCETPYRSNGVATADGAVYVTCGGADGVLCKLRPDGTFLARVPVGHTPMAPVVAEDGATVYVLTRFDNAVVKIDTAAMKVVARVAAPREPVAATLGGNGRWLFVGNHLPNVRSAESSTAAAVSVIDMATFQVARNVFLPNGSTDVRGMTASPDQRFIYVTHALSRYQLPTTQLEHGWMTTAALSVIDGETGKYVNTVLLDDLDLGAANPWGVTSTPDGEKLIVAHAGTREISVIEREALHKRIEQAAPKMSVGDVGDAASDVPNDLAFLAGIRQRVKLDGDGPRGVVVAGNTVYAAMYFSDALAQVKLDGVVPQCRTIPLLAGKPASIDRTRRGEMLWNDATICLQQWASCATCHPDGRSDGLNWDLLNDGIGNPKQTKSLVYCHVTPPTMATGVRADMQECNRKGLSNILFARRSEEDALCIDAYVQSLQPEPSPFLVNGNLSPLAKRGEKVFYTAGCVTCHSSNAKESGREKLFTNLKKYDLGFGTGTDRNRPMDTPTLVETWRTAPYLHDGRALTFKEVLTNRNPNNAHGNTSNLTSEEVEALVEFLRSL